LIKKGKEKIPVSNFHGFSTVSLECVNNKKKKAIFSQIFTGFNANQESTKNEC
jgi:hypothetical protein